MNAPQRNPAPLAVLELSGLRTRYGRIEAIHGVDVTVGQGQLVALIGANGAGKTTLLRCISGTQPLSAGRITAFGQDISTMRPEQRVRLGISQVPEGRQVFAPMTIEDNLRMGAFTRPAAEIEARMEEMFALFPVLKEKRALLAGNLSGGQQQMLALARALMAKPKLLLLDEPSMGLAPLIVEEIFRVIERLKAAGMTILLVEQNASMSLEIADYAYVLETGEVVLSGPGKDLLTDSAVQSAYLGI